MSTIALTGSSFHDPLEQLLHELAKRVDSVVNGIAQESRQYERYEDTNRSSNAVNDEMPICDPAVHRSR